MVTFWKVAKNSFPSREIIEDIDEDGSGLLEFGKFFSNKKELWQKKCCLYYFAIFHGKV
jgi:hypothetical protein